MKGDYKMKGAKLRKHISRLLVLVMVLSLFAFSPKKVSAAEPGELLQLIEMAGEVKAGNSEFPVQVSELGDGSDVNKAFPWVTADEMKALEDAIAAAQGENADADALQAAIDLFKQNIKSDGSDPYFRLDPGLGQVQLEVTSVDNSTWKTANPNDYRVPKDFGGSTFEVIDYPFADFNGQGQVLRVNYVNKATTAFGGITLRADLSPVVNVPAGSSIEFDVYYPKSAQGKFMRWRVSTNGSTTDTYMRDYEYNNLNPDWVGSYDGETYLVNHHSVVASTGNSSTFTLELHGESSRPAETSTLLIANIKIVSPDPNGTPLPMVQNTQNQSQVAPLKSLYNEENGLFMVGAIGTGTVNGTRARHYEIFVDGNNLKAESTHPRGPQWLTDVDGNSLSGANSTPGISEYSFPTYAYQQIRDSGEPGEYKSHAHVLAWYNQAPTWMRQIIPTSLPQGYNGTSSFYGLGNGTGNLVKVDKDMARRVQYNHVVYNMRHFLTTEAKYGSSESRGVIPFHSWDVLNEEVHESRHSEIIPNDANEWRTALKHTNWLVAMSDDEISGDVSEHYIYLLFKYAHIAAPNAQMAAAYKANYDSLPEYMKLDGLDTDGSIDAYIIADEDIPKLTYNDYGTGTRSKARVIYNMVKELNTAWQSDPLYDGRPLIEVIGNQGHDAIKNTLASDYQYSMGLYASLVDAGLLSGISYSEFDIKVNSNAPGGGTEAPGALNVRQSDALGYQYALMYKLFTKFAPYVDHIISWGVQGSGWQGSYVLFDGNGNANAGYYGAMNPDRYILGHSYLDYFYDGEYEKLADGYEIDLGDLGVYKPGTGEPTNPVEPIEPEVYFNVTFKHMTGQIVDTIQVIKGGTAVPSKLPVYPGYTFTGWDKDLSNVQSNMVVNAVFTKKPGEYVNVKVNDGVIVGGNLVAENTYNVERVTRITVKALDKENEKFVGWQNSDGVFVSHKPTYKFYVYSDMSLSAIYETEEPTAIKPDITMDKVVEIDYSGPNPILYFVAQANVPAGFKTVEVGTLRLKDSDLEAFDFNTAGVKKHVHKTNSVGQYILAIKTKMNYKWSVVAYITYEDAEGNTFTVFSNKATATPTH